MSEKERLDIFDFISSRRNWENKITNIKKLEYENVNLLSIFDTNELHTFLIINLINFIIIKNIKQVKHFMPNVTLEYTFTVSWPNVFQIEKVVDALTFNAQPQINFNLVYSDLFNLQVLPKNIKISVEEYLRKINKNKMNQNVLNGLISFMNSEDKSNLMTNAIARLKEVDLRRDESFITAFPEYKEMAIEYGY